MKNKPGLRTLQTLIALMTIAGFGMVAYNLTNSSETNKGNGAIFFEAPLFTSIAEASSAAGAFPEDVAGISAYVSTGQTIDIEKIKTIFSEVEKIGDNYIVGITPISNFGGNIGVHLYADKDGWLVAYLKNDEPTAKIMQWGSADIDNPVVAVINIALEDALFKAGEVVGVGIKSIKYYHFNYPDATSMMIFVKTRATDGTNIVQFEIPATYRLYEASYYHYSYDADDSIVKIDG